MNTRRPKSVLDRRSRSVTTIVTMAVALGLLPAVPAQAAPVDRGRPAVNDREKLVKGHRLGVRPRKTDPADRKGPAAKKTWPTAGTAKVTVPSPDRSGGGRAVRAGKLPISIAAPRAARGATAKAPDAVNVRVLDLKDLGRSGGDGMVFTVARADAAATPGAVQVQVDYSAFAQAYGGGYGSRLRLVQLPACALTTPQRPECRTAKPLDTRNDAEEQTLTVQIDAAAGAATRTPASSPAPAKTTPAAAPGDAPRGLSAARTALTTGAATVLAVDSGSGGVQGDYTATSLSSSATWQAGGNAGDFTWSYPMRVPPVPGGMAPQVQLSYSSASVDGRTGNANGQPSWVGEGFDLWPGFIERSYKSCKDDGAPKDQWGNDSGDLCWGYDNATLTWNGKGGELIPAGSGKWKLKNDDGTRIEKLTSAATANGDNDNEYWKVTTTDGVQYFFGHGKADGSPQTNSTWTVPVFGDDDAEPCHGASFASSSCQQAWRWNLDYVVDRNGNAIVYTYTAETNHYGRNLKPEDETPYERGGYLSQISYGLRAGALAATPPAKVTFGVAERCIPDADFDCDPSKIGDNPNSWWDVPFDFNCNAGQECKETHGTVSPTFWSRKRLTTVTTEVIKADGTYRPVDSWSLDHHWGLADVDRDLLLKEIRHTGHAGASSISLPKVTFNHVQLPNRLDKTGDDILPYIRYRVGAIYDESGGQIDVSYSEPDCTLSDLPTPATNTTRCMPVRWEPPGREDPITDWFIKYVVTSVIQTDRTGLGDDMATRYDYLGGAAWHYDDDDGLTKEKYKTWSQWRGYGHVRVRTGDYLTPATQTDSYYLRGMDGDRLNADGGSKDVSVADGEGGTVQDHPALAGFQLRTETYDRPGGSIVTKSVNTPWRHQTASRTRPWGTVTADLTGVSAARSWQAMPEGTWRQTRANTGYDTETGRVNWADDLGDVATADDDKCTRTTYHDDDSKWYKSFPSRVDVVSVTCADTTPDRKNRTISDIKTSYNAQWNPTLTEQLVAHDGTTPTYKKVAGTEYDGYGRPIKVTDVHNNAGTTVYTQTPATGGLTTKITVTTPPVDPATPTTAHQTTQDLDPAWGAPVTSIDVAGKRTDIAYDALGRSTKVWLPNRSKASNQVPNLEFDYRIADGQIVAVTTKTLTAQGGQRAGIALLDGWLRSRQTQAPGPDGRIITDTFYDNRGLATKAYAPYSATGAPETALFGVDTPGNVETQTRSSYDGLGRVTTERLLKGNGDTQELWRTTTSYDGNRTHVQPPAGGTPTTTITDARGNTTQVIQHGTGGADSTVSYGYDHAGRPNKITGPGGKQWTTGYDLLGRKIQSVDPDTGTTSYGYDDLGRLISTDNARSTKDKLFHKYDVLGRKTETRAGSATGTLLATWTYDTVRKGALTSATRKAAGPDGNLYDYTTKISAYDVLGRPTSTNVTIPSVEGVGTSYTFGTRYNLDDTVQSLGLPAAGGLSAESLVTTYDAHQRPTRLTSNLATYVNATTYSPLSKPLQYELGNVTGKRVWLTTTWQYGTGRLDTSRINRENVTGSDRYATYNYTDAGDITSITDTAATGTETQCFGYDHLRRLTDAWTQTAATCPAGAATATIAGPAPYRLHYAYNAEGNRTTEQQYGAGTAGGVLQATRTYQYAGAPGLDPSVQGHMLGTVTQTGTSPYTGAAHTETYRYDPTGNTTERKIGTRTQTFTYNDESQISAITDTGAADGTGKGNTSFVYTADGDRLIRRDPTGTTLYLPDTEVKLAKGATTPTGTRYYTHAGETIATRTTTGVTYLPADHQGTTQATIDAADPAKTARRRYTPFGQPRGTNGTWPTPLDKGFVGGTNDTTTLTHLGAREYNPNTGRFTTVDPIFDPTDPQSWNGYAYSANSPITKSDPSGLMACATPAECKNTTPRITDDTPRNNWVENNHPGHIDYGRNPPPDTNHTTPALQNFRGIVVVAPNWDVYITALFKALDSSHKSRTGKNTDDLMDNPLRCLRGEKTKSGCGPADNFSLYYFAKDHFCKQSGIRCAESDKALQQIFASAFALLGPSGRLGGARARGRDCRSSFVPGTTVLMADGTRKPIEDIQVGDKVIATDPESGKTQPKTVLATITSAGTKNLVEITVDTGDGPGDNTGLVIATDEHPFWVAGDIKRWIKAEDLKPGMRLRTSAGVYVQVSSVSTYTSLGQRVHNLTVADHHTYYVLAGATPVLVHNTNCPIGSVIGPGGETLPLPKGAAGTPSRNGKGWTYSIPAGTEVLDPRVTHVRVMAPVTTGKHQLPNGYVVYMNKGGQTVNPITGQTVSKADPYAHIPIP